MQKRIKLGRVRVYLRGGWKSKDHPYWYFTKTGTGGFTLQSMWLNIHVFGK